MKPSAAAHRPAPPAPPRAHQVVVLDGAGNPMQTLIVPRATALETLDFIRSMIDMIGMERLARKDGLTFEHALSGGIGAAAHGAISAYPKDQE